MSWWQSIVICAILTIVVTAVYAGLLWLMRVEEFSSLIVTMKARLLRRTSTATSVSTPAESETEEAQGTKRGRSKRVPRQLRRMIIITMIIRWVTMEPRRMTVPRNGPLKL